MLPAGSQERSPEPTAVGLQQFFEHQSNGIRPENPDAYYIALMRGKEYFDLQSRELQQAFIKQQDWPGFFQLWKNFKGERHYLPEYLGWYKTVTGRTLPEWLTNEDDEYIEGNLKNIIFIPINDNIN